MKVVEETLGTMTTGQCIKAYTLVNDMGMSVRVMNLGAVVLNINIPTQDEPVDVVLGYEKITDYETNASCHGAVVGRNANRIGNASFVLNGVTYELEKNDGNNTLHSGNHRWHQRIWDVTQGDENEDASITFSLNSPHMDQGFPGEVEMSVTYTLDNDNALRIHYLGTTTQDTVINVTNHSYFNLDGHGAGSVRGQSAQIFADFYTKAGSGNIPTGELVKVDKTPMDFRVEKLIGQDIDADYEALRMTNGYDQNWVLKNDGNIELAATLYSPKTNILMEVFTDCPGIQMYTGNFLNDAGKDGVHYVQNSGVALETQFYPDAINHANFPQPVTRAVEEYDSTTVYRFSQR